MLTKIEKYRAFVTDESKATWVHVVLCFQAFFGCPNVFHWCVMVRVRVDIRLVLALALSLSTSNSLNGP